MNCRTSCVCFMQITKRRSVTCVWCPWQCKAVGTYVRTYVHVYARPFCDISTPPCYSVHRHRISVSSHLHTCTTHSPTHTHMPSHMHTSPQIFCAGLLRMHDVHLMTSPCLIIVIDSATYLLTISSPDVTLSVCVCVCTYVCLSSYLVAVGWDRQLNVFQVGSL